jgi:hypothetical protein
VIEEVRGPESADVCKLCGAVRPFGNSEEAAELLASGALTKSGNWRKITAAKKARALAR